MEYLEVEGFQNAHHDIETIDQENDLDEEDLAAIEHELVLTAWLFRDSDKLPKVSQLVIYTERGREHMTSPEAMQLKYSVPVSLDMNKVRVVGTYRFGEEAGKNPRPYFFPQNTPSTNVRYKLLWCRDQFDKGNCTAEDLDDCIKGLDNLVEFCESRNSIAGMLLDREPDDPTTLFWNRMTDFCRATKHYLENYDL